MTHLTSAEAIKALTRLKTIEGKRVALATSVKQQVAMTKSAALRDGHGADLAEYFSYLDKVVVVTDQNDGSKPVYPTPPGLSGGRVQLDTYYCDYLTDWVKDCVDRTRTSELAIGLALQAHHVNNRAYPEQLLDLVPQYLPNIPLDPFAATGLFAYRNLGAKYVLYSVGPDGVDDGGKAIATRRIEQNSTGDIVAGNEF